MRCFEGDLVLPVEREAQGHHFLSVNSYPWRVACLFAISREGGSVLQRQNKNPDQADSQQMPPPDAFRGYQVVNDIWARMPMDLVTDLGLSREEITDMLLIGAEIGLRQFHARVDRFTAVPISGPDGAVVLRLSVPSAAIHLAALEEKGRLLVYKGKGIPGRNGGLIVGSNLYCLRWIDTAPTVQLASRPHSQDRCQWASRPSSCCG